MFYLLKKCFFYPPNSAWMSIFSWLNLCSIIGRELRFSSAMIFAIEEINNSSELLPGIKLGYQIYDSCAAVPVAVQVAFQLSNGHTPVFYEDNNCSQFGVVKAIVGESGSTPSISMSHIFGSFHIPQVNYLTIVLLNFCKNKSCLFVCSFPLKSHKCNFHALGEPLCHLCLPVR